MCNPANRSECSITAIPVGLPKSLPTTLLALPHHAHLLILIVHPRHSDLIEGDLVSRKIFDCQRNIDLESSAIGRLSIPGEQFLIALNLLRKSFALDLLLRDSMANRKICPKDNDSFDSTRNSRVEPFSRQLHLVRMMANDNGCVKLTPLTLSNCGAVSELDRFDSSLSFVRSYCAVVEFNCNRVRSQTGIVFRFIFVVFFGLS